MSQRAPACLSSGRIYKRQIATYRLTNKRIPDRSALEHIDVPPKKILQFGCDTKELKTKWPSLWIEPHHHVDIAVGPEIVTHDRPEEGKLNDAPFLAERTYRVHVHAQALFQRRRHHAPNVAQQN